jgi:hypothetical protein
MSTKQTIEAYRATFALVFLVGVVSEGIGATKYFLASSGHSAPRCEVEGTEPVETNHGDRIATLQESLANLDHFPVSDAQSAPRTRADISAENAVYQTAIKKLSMTCK